MNGQRLVGAGVHPGTQLRQQVHQPHPHALERGHLAGDLGEVLPQHALVLAGGDGRGVLVPKSNTGWVKGSICQACISASAGASSVV